MHYVGVERIRIGILKGGHCYKTALTLAALAIIAKEKDRLPRDVTKTVST